MILPERKQTIATSFISDLWPLDTPAADFGALEPLVSLWRERRQAGNLPAWTDFAFSDFRGWHGAVCVSEFVDKRPDPRFRLFGSNAAGIVGGDFTGRRFSDMVPGEVFKATMSPTFSQVRKTPAIILVYGQVPVKNRDHVYFQAVEMPLSKGGKSVTGLLHVLIQVGEEKEWARPPGKALHHFEYIGHENPFQIRANNG